MPLRAEAERQAQAALDAAKSAVGSQTGRTVGVSIVTGGAGFTIGALSVQGMVDKLTAELGAAGIVLLFAAVGLAAFSGWLLRIIFGEARITKEVVATQAAASIQGANATASSALTIQDLTRTLKEAVGRVEDLEGATGRTTAAVVDLRDATRLLHSKLELILDRQTRHPGQEHGHGGA